MKDHHQPKRRVQWAGDTKWWWQNDTKQDTPHYELFFPEDVENVDIQSEASKNLPASITEQSYPDETPALQDVQMVEKIIQHEDSSGDFHGFEPENGPSPAGSQLDSR